MLGIVCGGAWLLSLCRNYEVFLLSTNTIRIISKIHGHIYRFSRGRIGKRFGKLGFLLLTTTGRKSGKSRSVPLPVIPVGPNYIFVASFGGNPSNPDWLLNIRLNPEVSIRIGSVAIRSKATIIETTEHGYEELWEKAIAIYKGYDDYKKATSRQIPIVVVTPYNL